MDRNVNQLLDGGMTVSELISTLEDMDPEAVVFFTSDYGDYSHTAQALPISDIEPMDSTVLHDTAYSKSGVAIQEDDPQEPESEDDVTRIVVLS